MSAWRFLGARDEVEVLIPELLHFPAGTWGSSKGGSFCSAKGWFCCMRDSRIRRRFVITFSEYQRLALRYDKTGSEPTNSLMVTLLGLAGETGSLLTEYKKWLREGQAYKPFSHQV